MAMQPTPWQPPASERIGDRPVFGGDVFIPASPDKKRIERRNEARADAKDARDTAKDTFRTLTPEEAVAEGLSPLGVYQKNGLGQINVIKAPPEDTLTKDAAKTQRAAQNLLQAAGVAGGKDPVSELIIGSTSGGLEKAGADAAAFFGTSTGGMQNIARLQTIVSDMVLALNNGSLGSGVSNADVDFIKQRVGNLADPNVPAETRLAAWQEVRDRLKRVAGETVEDAPTGQGDVSAQVDDGVLRNFDPNDPTRGGLLPVDPRVKGFADKIEARDGEAGLLKLATSGATLGLLDESAGVGGAIGELLKGNTDLAGNYEFWRDVERELQRRAKDRTGMAGTAAEFVGGGGAVRAAGTAAMTLGRAALEGGAVGGIAGFGYGEGANDSLAGAGLGAIGGAAAGAGLQRLAGRGGGGTPPGGGRVEPDASNVIAIGNRENVPVMTSDVRRPRTWFGNWLQGTGEKLPIIGTGGMRAAQQESRVAMIERLADDYAQTPATIDDVTSDFMKTRGDQIAKFTQQKREVFGSLAGAPPPVAQNSLDVLDKAIGRYSAQETFSGLASKLQNWRNDLASARSIDDVEALRKSIGDTFNDETLKSASTAMRDIVNGPDGLYAAIKKDMGGYISENAGQQALTKWSSANARLSDFADDLEKNTIKRVLRTGEATPEEAATLLFSKKPSDVKALFANLSPEGQKRARSVIVQKLVDDAGGINELSTAKFRTALQRSADTFGVSFPRPEAERLTGMLRLLQATRRAEQASVATPTGQAALPFAGATGVGFLAGDWFGAAGVGTATAAAFRAYESKAMRNLLVALNKTRPGSRAESNVVATIQKVVAANAPNVVNLRVGASPMPLAAEGQNTRRDTSPSGPMPR